MGQKVKEHKRTSKSGKVYTVKAYSRKGNTATKKGAGVELEIKKSDKSAPKYMDGDKRYVWDEKDKDYVMSEYHPDYWGTLTHNEALARNKAKSPLTDAEVAHGRKMHEARKAEQKEMANFRGTSSEFRAMKEAQKKKDTTPFATPKSSGSPISSTQSTSKKGLFNRYKRKYSDDKFGRSLKKMDEWMDRMDAKSKKK